MLAPDDVADLIEEFGLARGSRDPYGGGHARYPPCREPESKRNIRPNYSPFAKKLPNNSAYFSLDVSHAPHISTQVDRSRMRGNPGARLRDQSRPSHASEGDQRYGCSHEFTA